VFWVSSLYLRGEGEYLASKEGDVSFGNSSLSREDHLLGGLLYLLNLLLGGGVLERNTTAEGPLLFYYFEREGGSSY